nr:MAG TPA: hypothetical protein [Caudoviricetes sp.]
MGTQTFMGLFYFFGIGGTNPASFGLLKSPSGIPPPIMYKKRPDHTAQALRYILLKNGASRQK